MEQYTKTLIADYNNKVIAEAYLTKMTDSEAILFLENPEISEPILFVGKSIKLNVIDNFLGVFVYTGVVSYRLVETFHVKNIKLIDKIQRRKDVKLLINYQCEIYTIQEKTNGSVTTITKTPVLKNKITLKDISAGGVGFSCDEPLNKETSYHIDFTEGRVPIELEFKILNTRSSKEGEYVYGCSFINQNNKNESVIREYIFKMQNAASKLT